MRYRRFEDLTNKEMKCLILDYYHEHDGSILDIESIEILPDGLVEAVYENGITKSTLGFTVLEDHFYKRGHMVVLFTNQTLENLFPE